MKTAESIERQESRKRDEKESKDLGSDTCFFSQLSEPVSEGRRRRLADLKPFPKGRSGNPGGAQV